MRPRLTPRILFLLGLWALPELGPVQAAPLPAAPTEAESKNDAVARALFERAMEEYQAGRMSSALLLFKETYVLKKDTTLLYNIARCHEKLDQRLEAISYYQSFLNAADADPSLRRKAMERMESLSAAAAPPTPPSAPPSVVTPKVGSSPDKGGTPQQEPGTPESSPGAVSAGANTSAPPPAGVVLRKSPSKWTPASTAGVTLGGTLLLASVVTGALALSKNQALQNTLFVGEPPPDVKALSSQVRGLAISTDVLLGVGAVTVGVTLLATFGRRKVDKAH